MNEVYSDSYEGIHPLLYVASNRREDNNLSQKLCKISGELKKRDLNSIKFLIKDLVSGSKLETMNSGLDIIQLLIDNRKIDLQSGNMNCLKDCLYFIGRIDLLKYFNANVKEFLEELRYRPSKLNNYRIFLFKLSDEMKKGSVKDLKSYLEMNNLSTTRKLSEVENALQLFMLLEEEGLINENDINFLKTVFSKMLSDCGYLQKLVDEYEIINGKTLEEIEFETDSKEPITYPR